MNNCCNNLYPEMDMKRWESCPSTMLANADNYYTKSEVDEIIEDISISGGGITSGEVQTQIDASVEPIEGSVEALSGAVEQLSTDMENKADKSDIPSLENYYNKSEVNTIIEDNEYTISQAINDLNDRKLDASAYTPVDMSDYWTSGETQEAINAATSGTPSSATIERLRTDVNALSGDVTNLYETKLDASAYTPTDLSNYYTKSQIDTKLNGKENNLEMYEESRTGHPYDWYAKIETIDYNFLELNHGGIIIAANEDSSISLEAPSATLNQSPIVNEDRAYEIAEEYIAYTVQCSLDGETTGSGQWDSSGSFRFKLNEDTPEYSNTLPALKYSVTRYSGNTPDEFVISPSDGTGQYKKGNATLRGFEVEGYQKTLSAGTGIAINGNVISATGGGSGITVDQSLDSGSTNPVTNSAITNALDAKADASDVYNKTEVNNLISNKANVWCGDEASFNALTNKDANTIYLVY